MKSYALLLLALAMVSGGASAQSLCACSPRVYTMALNFSKTCEPIGVNFDTGGIADATCFVRGGPDNDVTDLTPVVVEAIQFIEIGQEGAPIAVSEIPEEFQDGDTVNYTSVASFAEGAVVVPRALQANILAKNAAGEEIALLWSIAFTNNCGIYPVLEEDDNIGWAVFTDLGTPETVGCPGVDSSSSTQEEAEGSAVEEDTSDMISNSNDCALGTPILTQSCNETVDHQLCVDDPKNIALMGTETWTMPIVSPASDNGLSCEDVALNKLEQPVAEMRRQDPLLTEVGPSEISCNDNETSCTEVRPCELRCKDIHAGTEVPTAGAVQEEMTQAPTAADESANTATDSASESSSGHATKGSGRVMALAAALVVGHAGFY